jgi:hypothetical protein
MDDLLNQARKASRDSEECRETMTALEAIMFDRNAFPKLHHLADSMDGFYRYCGTIKEFRRDDNNHRVHQRLRYVLLSCRNRKPPDGKSFQSLALEAFRLIPPIR